MNVPVACRSVRFVEEMIWAVIPGRTFARARNPYDIEYTIGK
jgi:hypothetical protein